jgi:tRNA (guanine-N7-)-methyltransferase
MASDDPTYQAWVAECFAGQGLFTLAAVSDSRPEGWFPTRYEAKAIAAGRTPRYWVWRRI